MAGKQADIKVGVITNYDDKGLKQAASGLSGFKTSIAEADGFTGKFKAGFSSLGDTIAQKLSGPAGIAAIGGIFAAAGDFALQAVNKFSQLGVAVGQLKDATGLSADAASRWIETAGDIGIDAGTLELGIGKLNKTLGNTPGMFSAAGIAIAKTKDGATDVNQTFLNTIDALKRINNPAERAALATKLLGKGWRSMAELIEQGSGTLKTSLADVADAKVFDDAKIQKAREFREAMDKLKDVAEEFVIQMGTQLEPAIESLAKGLTKLAGLWQSAFGGMAHFVLGIKEWVLETTSLSGAQDEVTVSLKDQAAQMAETDRENRKLIPTWEQVATAEDEARAAQVKFKLDSDNTKRAVKQNIDEMIGKWDELTGDVNADKAWVTLQGSFDQVRVKFEEANEAIKKGTDDAAQKTLDYKGDLDDVILSTITYGKEVLKLPPEKLVTIKTALEAGELQRALDMIAILTRNKNINIAITAKGGAGFNDTGGPSFDEGGVVGGPVGAPVAATVHGGETVRTPEQEAALGGGGTTNNYYTINMPVGTSPDEMMRTLQKHVERNGPGPLRKLAGVGVGGISGGTP